MYNAETADYARLQDYQGHLTHRLLAAVTLHFMPAGSEGDSSETEFFHVKGILLEYIEGFSLSKLATQARISSWQGIINEAVKIVHVLSDNNVLNADVRPDSFIVTPHGNDDGYRVVMIDFGHSRLRREDESDFEWDARSGGRTRRGLWYWS
jgi:serine/threonine protein kinase